MTGGNVPERADQGKKGGYERDKSPLQAAWRTDAKQLPHEQAEIEAGRVNQQPLANVRMSAKVHAAHPARLKEMREGPFQAFSSEPQQPLAACAANATTIAIHRLARGGVLLPVPSPAIRFRDVSAQPHGFEIHERLVAVIALVTDDLLKTVAVGAHR